MESDLAKVISLWTGIPATKIEENDIKKLANLESELKEHIIGQDTAIEKVSNAVRRGRVNISPKKDRSRLYLSALRVSAKRNLLSALQTVYLTARIILFALI